MGFRLELRFDSPVQLQAHLLRYVEQGGVIIPDRLCPGLALPDTIELEFVVGALRALGRGQALRRERLGIVVELDREALEEAFALLPRDLPPPPREIPGRERPVAVGRLGGTAGRPSLGSPASLGSLVMERVRPSAEAPGRDPVEGDERGMIDATDLPPATITPVGLVAIGEFGEDLSQRTLHQAWDDAFDEWAREPATQGVPPPPELGAGGAGGADASARSADLPIEIDVHSEDILEEDSATTAPRPVRGAAATDGESPSAATAPALAATPPGGTPALVDSCPSPGGLPADLGPAELLRLACDPDEGRRPERVLEIIRHPRASRALAMRLLGRLGPRELAALAADRALPVAFATAARRRLLQAK